LTKNVMGTVSGERFEPLGDGADDAAAYELLQRRMTIQRTLSWQLIEHGDTMEGQ
ncbi:MAG: hypothetical protein HXO82_09415, partial [Selenomonas sp.]|nr:hypothetical protein [Selenomonas sp.]